MRFSLSVTALLMTLFFVSYASAQHTDPDEPISEPALEQRARDIFHALRCEVCEGQSLAGSDALLAQDMRRMVRKQVLTGKTQEDILAFFAKRYGQSILMRPPVTSHTWLLWLGPLGFILCGLIVLVLYFRASRDNQKAKTS